MLLLTHRSAPLILLTFFWIWARAVPVELKSANESRRKRAYRIAEKGGNHGSSQSNTAGVGDTGDMNRDKGRR
jgi:hypothetical protein